MTRGRRSRSSRYSSHRGGHRSDRRRQSRELRPFGIRLGGWLMIAVVFMITIHEGWISVHR